MSAATVEANVVATVPAVNINVNLLNIFLAMRRHPVVDIPQYKNVSTHIYTLS